MGKLFKSCPPFFKGRFSCARKKKHTRNVFTNADTWVIDIEKKIVGFIALIGNEVGAIFLQPDHQGNKLGKLMMDKAQKLHGDLEVEVFKKNSIGRNFTPSMALN